MKILVVGCKGMLGTELTDMLREAHETIGIDVDQLDITDNAKTMAFIKEIAPDMVINCAAYTNVDGCETEVLLAYRVNATGPKNLAIACNEGNIPLVHISTDYVFDGKKGTPYEEDDVTNPLSVYGKSKLAGEQNVKNHCSRHYIIRTQWLYGKNGPNFVKTMLKMFKEKKSLRVVNDQFGQPTYVKDLCRAIVDLIEQPDYGTYHVTNQGIISWFDFANDILELSGLVGVTIAPCTTEQFPRPATRPAYAPLENFHMQLIGKRATRHYKEALKEYIDEEIG